MSNALKGAAIVALLAIAFAAVLFVISWRQHYPPCPNYGPGPGPPLTCMSGLPRPN